MAHDHRRNGHAPTEGPSTTRSSAHLPGKRTLTENLFESSGAPTPAPLQRKAAGPSTEGNVHEAAQRGIADGGSRLPHLDLIQRSFGAHDVSNVQAHTGEAAAHANSEIGAQAYATGNHVAFAGTPDLHTAAHEAAHVVQQRAGVHLSGGVGQAGDPYERHADAVADAVVSGRSAEGLLSQMAPSGASPSSGQATAPLQRQEVAEAAVDAGTAGAGAGADAAAAAATDTKVLSGASWVSEYPTGTTIAELTDATFKDNVQAFHDAMIAAATPENNLSISISATYRPVERAHLMHYCFKVHNGTTTPAAANTASNAAGININWDHGNLATSKAKAGEMKTAYDIAYAPALTSRHTEGKAIDWTITWSGSLMIAKKGETTKLDCTGNGATSANLRQVGASYGVHKLVSDPPHWSTDGK